MERTNLAVDTPLYERIKKEARRQDRSVRKVGRQIVLKGLEALEKEREQQQAKSPSMTGS